MLTMANFTKSCFVEVILPLNKKKEQTSPCHIRIILRVWLICRGHLQDKVDTHCNPTPSRVTFCGTFLLSESELGIYARNRFLF